MRWIFAIFESALFSRLTGDKVCNQSISFYYSRLSQALTSKLVSMVIAKDMT